MAALCSPSRPLSSSRNPQKDFVCKICDSNRWKTFGVAVLSLKDLVAKGKQKLGLDKHDPRTCTVVLEEDGTIVDEEDYFEHLPINTKFMILGPGEKWMPQDVEIRPVLDTRTHCSIDCVDSAEASSNWKVLAHRLRQNLAEIITMSEAELQTLIDVPTAELAVELEVTPKRAEDMQDSLQRTLDTKEEQRQAIELLKLYQNAFDKDDATLAEKTEVDSFGAATSQTTQLNQHIIDVLRKKPSPEISLSSRELQEVLNEKEKNLASALHCSTAEVKKLQQDCKKEFGKRSTTVQHLEQLSQYSSKKRKQ
ncbi:DNA fragmentation factor subunit alpha [Hypanus sabinus]|uniref:DNA fragmentation factor subunit alpha n=1 Tax=Hypanus sabinus TaxID=79690 RepID=UPI0028C3BAA8|nr:DNA fragmentation factor subunit alpha [Hypanus sabinus]